MADSKEAQFQQDIIDALAAQGWRVGTASGYDRRTALYTEDVLGYFKEAWPERWDKFAKANPSNPDDVLVQKLVRELEQSGTLDVLRHGFKLPAVKVELCSFQPDHGMNPDTLKRYQCNRLCVVPEVSYSPHAREAGSSGQSYNPRLDLVLFVNGIPTATLELKSEFKQSVENAKRQYRYDRPVKDPLTRKPEPLLTFKRGALVHFAVGQNEVAMTTKLAGKDTFFLPFNLGSAEGGAGNPQPEDDSQYATSYLWQRLMQPDAWLKVLGRFLHLDKKTSEGFDGTPVTKETMIFPRYHQWEVVNQLINTTRTEGPGKRYLIQHSAGSGKSNSIAWTAHQLASLYNADGQRLFNSVIVITDRTVLDKQLQDTIYQFEHAQGVVKQINRETSSQSKSEQLAEALAEQTRIIIVTIQTFPALFDALDKYPKLASGRYAVIADEAHSSQTGSSASKLKQILGSDAPDSEDISAEELLDAAVQARQPNERISYYAFTATPKAKTLELFGRPADPTLPASSSNKPEAFHLYSMRQAIEEGFILDVLRNYTTYSTAWKIAHPDGEDDEVDSKKARIKLARWVRLHPYNISQKVEVIVEHFRANIRGLLNGQAKAMVVTSSRQEAVRYQLALKAYVQQMGYNDVHPLVAFSGSVLPDEVIPEEVTESSSLLNAGLNGRDLAQAFDTQDFNVMIAANKYQTGFDQPKLCAMYVDKKLQGVDCVQTLSRLNRTFGDSKETFILDFFNEPQDILDAFLPYYTKAELTDVTDPQIIYDLQKKLDAEGIYHWQEVEAFAMAFFDPKAAASKLSYYCTPAKERFAKRYAFSVESRQQALDFKRTAEANGDSSGLKKAEHALKEAGEQIDQLDLFRKNLQSFVRLYEFLSQIVPYEDRELEQLCVYAKHLHPLLRVDRLQQDDVDVGELQLSHYRLSKRAEHQLRLNEETGEYTLKPSSDVGSGKPHDPEKKRLSEIIEALNDIFGAEVSDDDQLQFLTGIAQRISRQEDVMAQVNNHSVDQVMHGLFPKRVLDTVLDAMTDHEKLSLEVLDNETKSRAFALVILKMLKTAAGFDQSGLHGA
ncbi:TPA: type I restriction endonuclease subunit R [Pseudomonas putida]|uniref:type I restriction endonuclease subunit R n=1 Tax=Pseudomonas putida TaxID=303 RepID=UPI00110CB8C7|nr:DEAD/DEAH box helicase family protein [Pseudomonas putida]MDD1991884.1 DEAD/DEAH box helicase family protein [Pseudomonas putida]HDS0921073.1 type I restriction endonuclease subunit R [Pseudomonas putida]HDS0932863.1 type I restriction endonuclease subunit R [Pseudomonas putida]HDS1783232.1 type I restriction endonuclease subunit R [Pseudomonas putida]HDS3798727.1 type I restriction endonuclease subunit R [Pseudomonas putida]